MRRLLPALTGSSVTSDITIDSIASLSWTEAKSRLDALLVVPETSTWARSRHRRPTGPQPVRDRRWPWGLPWLNPRDREQVEQQNTSLRQLFEIMERCVRLRPAAPMILLHPEDLGAADHGIPASVWQLPELKMWANRWGLKRYATHQCNFGESPWPFPLGVLSSHPLPHKLFRPGWPRFDPKSMKYIGPLPRSCGCARGYHKRDADFRDRHLRQRPDSIVQPDVLKFLIAHMLNAYSPHFSTLGLSSRGAGQFAAQGEQDTEPDGDAEDSTDDERAAFDEDELGCLGNGLDSAGGASLDALSLQALGIQDLQEATARIVKGSVAGGKVRDGPGHTGGGDYNYGSEGAHGTEGHLSGEGLLDDGFCQQRLHGTTLNSPEGQVKKKRDEYAKKRGA